ncbi:hypothetical protein FOZ61_002409 [Perkinsus olseni]|uniref:Uncharacterized protein n=1 Tax=Perkinsus olseni TaxID=32597 RepID=A0A7J6M924_PEROL|nr:hypothetical protein FOZ61_002409 [Perkinsus olseni]KAF4667916.1 hypothetical protein FOL46_002269 [Perkinsus olseni]
MTAALQKRELIFCLSNGEDRVPPGLGVSCFVAAITAEGGIVENFTPAVQNVLREVLDSCCDHYGRVAIDLVFKVMSAARRKVRQKDLQLWEDLFGGSTACIVQTTFEQGLSHWMSELGIDFIAANDMIRALLGVIDPYSTGIIQRDAFVESMGLCGGSDLLCAENLPIILSWAAERGKKAANLPSCPERSRARSLSSIPRPIHALKSEYPVAVVQSEVSEVPPSSPDEVLAISSSRYCDATEELDCSRSSRCRSDQSPAVHASLIARALRRPTQRRLWSSLVRLSSGPRLDREDAVRVRAIASLLRLSTIRRIAWGFSRMQTQVMGLNLEPQYQALADAERISRAKPSQRSVSTEEPGPMYDVRPETSEHVIALPYSPLSDPPRPGSIRHGSILAASHPRTPKKPHLRVAEGVNTPRSKRRDSSWIDSAPSPCAGDADSPHLMVSSARNFEQILEPQQQTSVNKWRKKRPSTFHIFA